MSVKGELRKKCRAKRHKINSIDNSSDSIIENFLSSELYGNADALLCYASLEDEIPTDAVIINAFSDGKKVYLPACKNVDGEMDFYEISSFNELVSGFFGVREPDLERCKNRLSPCNCSENTVCVVPGLAFDKKGFRLGYGKGYYDRFLSEYNGISVGFCYSELLLDSIPSDIYDKKVDYICCNSGILICK